MYTLIFISNQFSAWKRNKNFLPNSQLNFWSSLVLRAVICRMVLWNWYLTPWIEKLITISWLVWDASFVMNDSDLSLKWLILMLLITCQTGIYKWILTYLWWVGSRVTKCCSFLTAMLFVMSWFGLHLFHFLIDPLSYLFLCSICWLENEAWPSMVGVPLIFDQSLLHRRILHVRILLSENREW